MSKAFENEFLKNLGLLSTEQQSKVLAYIKTLLKTPQSSSHDLLRFAGSIDKADVEKMRAAIEAGCENIDKNEW